MADFGDDRRDVYKVYVRAGETLTRAHGGAAVPRGNLGLDMAIFPPGSTNIAAVEQRARSTARRSASAVSLLHARNTTGKDGYFLVQASVAARLGRLPPALERTAPARSEPRAARQAPSSSSGAHVAQHARGLPDHDRPRRHVAQHDRARADERVLADLDAGQQDRGAADAGPAPDHRALHQRACGARCGP